jgi:hypothetical protein
MLMFGGFAFHSKRPGVQGLRKLKQIIFSAGKVPVMYI